MTLDRITITGADDSISPDALIVLSCFNPFTEWGILASKSNWPNGYARFPSERWINKLKEIEAYQLTVEDGLDKPMKLSLHLCGRWVRQLLLGINEIPDGLIDGFQRVQLNFHAEKVPCNPHAFYEILKTFGNRQIIFQFDGIRGNQHFNSVYALSLEDKPEVRPNIVPLFDTSGGIGQLPDYWPEPVYTKDGTYLYHGYAGGLGPDNLQDQLPLIERAAHDAPIWIDMETLVRSEDDQIFELTKVIRCLKIAEFHMQWDRA